MTAKMSDYDKVKELFTALDLDPILTGGPDERRITLDEGCNRVDAYAGFFAKFCFEKDGSFLEVSIGEQKLQPARWRSIESVGHCT